MMFNEGGVRGSGGRMGAINNERVVCALSCRDKELGNQAAVQRVSCCRERITGVQRVQLRVDSVAWPGRKGVL